MTMQRYRLGFGFQGLNSDPEGEYVHFTDAQAAIEAKDTEIARLRDAAMALRNAQRAYMGDRGNQRLGRVVNAAAKVLDCALEDTP